MSTFEPSGQNQLFAPGLEEGAIGLDSTLPSTGHDHNGGGGASPDPRTPRKN